MTHEVSAPASLPVEAPVSQSIRALTAEDQRAIEERMLQALGNGGAGDVGMSEHEIRNWVTQAYLTEKEKAAASASPEMIQGIIRQAGASVLIETRPVGNIDHRAADNWC